VQGDSGSLSFLEFAFSIRTRKIRIQVHDTVVDLTSQKWLIFNLQENAKNRLSMTQGEDIKWFASKINDRA
jgi:hypothetical protein